MAKAKKDIDKELMYKKLMPSGPKAVKVTPQEDAAAEEVEVSAPAAQPPARMPMQEPLNQHRAVVRREGGVPFMDAQPTILVNTMENIVLEKLESVLSRFQCCKCDRCKKDIVAIALNKLSPKYKVLSEAQSVSYIDPQTSAEVVTALIQAVLAVRSHPRH